MQLPSNQSMKGYTLIEILVALTVVGILFGVGYVSFRDFSRRQSINSNARQVASDLRFAQELSASGKKPAGCTGSLDGYNFRVTSATAYSIEAKCSLAGVAQIVSAKTVSLINNVRVSTSGTNPILFKSVSEGTNIPAGQSVTLVLSQPGVAYTASLTIGQNGDIK